MFAEPNIAIAATNAMDDDFNILIKTFLPYLIQHRIFLIILH